MQTNKYSIDLLFHAMLMSSANDAANALGRAAGGQDKAVNLMNEKAAELGMSNTQAKNTSGLDAKGPVHDGRADLMKLAWAVCEDDYLMKVIGTETYQVPGREESGDEGEVQGLRDPEPYEDRRPGRWWPGAEERIHPGREGFVCGRGRT